MASVILMGESLCRWDPHVSLHLTVPDPPAAVQAWAAGRPEVELSTQPPAGVGGWDVKPSLLLKELDRGWDRVLWIDTDMIVTAPVSSLLDGFLEGAVIVAEEWNRQGPVPVSKFWNLRPARPLRVMNACFVYVSAAHRRLLDRWLELIHDPRYREASRLPFERRPIHLATDGWLLAALLESEEFGHVALDYLLVGRHIAQCAGSSGYRPHHRLFDLVRGLPPLIHCIGRKPWQSDREVGRVQRYLIDLATDVSPYVLAARRVARDLPLSPSWFEPRTSVGAMLRRMTAGHPAVAGLPLAVLHGVEQKVKSALRSAKHPVSTGPLLPAACPADRS